jgi:hypothetical protein
MVVLDPRLNLAGACQQRSYLLVLWRSDAEMQWQFMLEPIGHGEKRLFRTVDELATFLTLTTARVTEPSPTDADRPS